MVCPTNNADHDPNKPVRINHAVIGLMGEVGELASALEKWIYYGKLLDVANIKEELGDCLWYIAQLCNATGLSLQDIMTSNIAKLKVRYPEKYTDQNAETRDIEAERKALENPHNESMVVEQDGHGFGHVKSISSVDTGD